MEIRKFERIYLTTIFFTSIFIESSAIAGSEKIVTQTSNPLPSLQLQFYQVESAYFKRDSPICFEVDNDDVINWGDHAKSQGLGIDYENPNKALLEKFLIEPWSKSIVPYEAELTKNIAQSKILLISIEEIVQVIPDFLRGEQIFRLKYPSGTFEYPYFTGKVCTKFKNNDAFPFAVMLGKDQKLYASSNQTFDKELLFNQYILGNWPFDKKEPYDFTKTNLIRLVDDQANEYIVVEWKGHPCSTQWLVYKIAKGKAEFMQTNGGGC